MNRPLFALLCAAAALSGWGGMSFWRGMDTGPAGKPPAHLPAAGATDAGGFARPAGKAANPGSPGAVEALALARSLDPADEASLSKLKALPPGSARDLALALFESRVRAAGLPVGDGEKAAEFNPFADVPGDATSPSRPTMEQTIKRLLAGEPLEEFADDALKAEHAPFTGGGEPLIALDSITYWAGLDPAAASETILKMPPGKSRTAAVDAAAKVMSRDNPQAAWDLVLKSGEQKLGEGAARAWLECVGSRKDKHSPATVELPALLRDTVLKQAAELLKIDNGAAGGSPAGVSAAAVEQLSAQLPRIPFGPGKDAVWKALIENNPDKAPFLFTYPWEKSSAPDGSATSPEMEAVLAIMLPVEARNDPEKMLEQIGNPEEWEEGLGPRVFSAAAPEILGPLARAGHVKEVAPLLERIPDPQQRRTALESILPQWMDADPAAARAAFNAAPFTALERERWQRHPAFLLNPETGK